MKIINIIVLGFFIISYIYFIWGELQIGEKFSSWYQSKVALHRWRKYGNDY